MSQQSALFPASNEFPVCSTEVLFLKKEEGEKSANESETVARLRVPFIAQRIIVGGEREKQF